MEPELEPRLPDDEAKSEAYAERSLRSHTQSGTVSVLLADDHPVYLRGLRALLDEMPGFAVVETHTDGFAALQSLRRFEPGIAVLGTSLPGVNAIQLLKHIEAERMATRVVLLAPTEEEIGASIRPAPWGIVSKQAPMLSLTKCLSAIAAGERWLPSGLADQPAPPEAPGPDESAEFKALLTRSELQISLLVAEGLSNALIAQRLGVCEATIKTELYNAYGKLGETSRPRFTTLSERHPPLRPAKAAHLRDGPRGRAP